jgi:hypothetical protein
VQEGFYQTVTYGWQVTQEKLRNCPELLCNLTFNDCNLREPMNKYQIQEDHPSVAKAGVDDANFNGTLRQAQGRL